MVAVIQKVGDQRLNMNIITHDVWKVLVSLCLSTPAGLMVKILNVGIPTDWYEKAS